MRRPTLSLLEAEKSVDKGLSLSFCVCLLAFFSSRDLVFISTFMLLCFECLSREPVVFSYVMRAKHSRALPIVRSARF